MGGAHPRCQDPLQTERACGGDPAPCQTAGHRRQGSVPGSRCFVRGDARANRGVPRDVRRRRSSPRCTVRLPRSSQRTRPRPGESSAGIRSSVALAGRTSRPCDLLAPASRRDDCAPRTDRQGRQERCRRAVRDFPGSPRGRIRADGHPRRLRAGPSGVPAGAAQASVASLTLTVRILEQAVVTAAKAGEADAQTIPMAVSVLPGTELARMQNRSVEHLAGRAPGVTFSQNTGFAQLAIRGIGTNAVFAGSDPSSAVYLDGVYLARPAMVLADFLEIDRVEVLRGPQGTLYGRNSVGGSTKEATPGPAPSRFTSGSPGPPAPAWTPRARHGRSSGRILSSGISRRGGRARTTSRGRG